MSAPNPGSDEALDQLATDGLCGNGTGVGAGDTAIRSAPKYNETCFRCGESSLMWKLDSDDGEVKLWIPYSFHVCPDG